MNPIIYNEFDEKIDTLVEGNENAETTVVFVMDLVLTKMRGPTSS